GTVVEVLSDEMGIVWPESIAPYKVHLISLAGKKGGEKVKEKAEEIYAYLTKRGVEILYDDRDSSAGEKFSDSDLIGIPKRIIVSQRGIEEGSFEMKDRKTGEVTKVTEKELSEMFK
ncbi:MAG TPA: His/Gly/Thr/Pro-type tRNA ligase C-terminal domain-containing protein, partial [Candidatus Paceibacterota bacterium]|nr:His/Gly/Thr/Pro-type tRNA ligase C-terminal domain-containing protein [Candidatus Paceibacterota bacterium]